MKKTYLNYMMKKLKKGSSTLRNKKNSFKIITNKIYYTFLKDIKYYP